MKNMLLVCIAVLCGSPSLGVAQLLRMDCLTIDFTKVDEAKKKATWSTPDKIAITHKGLGWDGEPNRLRNGWVQTEPIGVGYSWRPAQSVSVQLVVTPEPVSFKLPSGQESIPSVGDAYIRHSPDGKHWSSWQELTRTNDKGMPANSFSGRASIPHRDRAEYGRLLLEYRKLDVPWVDDEEALAGWIIKRHPDFFRDHQPFVGYVQLLYENPFWGGQRLTGFEVLTSSCINGGQQESRDKDAGKDRDGPWRFRAP